MRIIAAFLTVVLIASTAMAQQAVPPPPRPPEDDTGPSLEASLKFIQEKVSDEGRFNFVVYLHDTQSNEEWSNRNTAEISAVTPDAANCRLTLHWKTSVNGKTAADGDYLVDLKTVSNIQIFIPEQELKRVDTGAAHVTREYHVEPTFSVLVLNRARNQRNTFFFHEEASANRVAKAVVHAVELCGGGSSGNEPF
jgi:hypothetical protein